MAKKTADEVREQVTRKVQTETPINSKNFVSSGSTILNLAITGKSRCAFAKGHYYFMVGDSSSGKTFLSLTCFAEATLNPAFADYRFIFDNAEDGALMDWVKFFGQTTADRVEPPAWEDGAPRYSQTVEELYYHLDDAKEEGRPFIYVLDSMDALSSAPEQDKASEKKAAHRKGKANEVSGSFGDGKAKINSAGLRQIMPFIRDSGSILIFIGQTKDDLSPSFGPSFGPKPKTRSGGRSLTFYACLEMWTSQAGHVKKRIKEKDRELGIYSKIRIKKNRISGRDRTVTIPILHSFGIDDIGGCVDYMVEEGAWKKGNKGIIAKDFDVTLSREALIRHIEEEGLQKELQGLVGEVWNDIEEACEVKREKRYE